MPRVLGLTIARALDHPTPGARLSLRNKHGDMRWTWAILFLAGGRAERRVVVEDFAKAGLWTDTGEVLGLPESIQPPIGTINLTNEGEALRFDYDVAFRALYGAAVLGRPACR